MNEGTEFGETTVIVCWERGNKHKPFTVLTSLYCCPVHGFIIFFSFGGGSIAAALVCAILLLDPGNRHVVRCSCIWGGMH